MEITEVQGQEFYKAGLKIMEVREGSPAKKANWRDGDVLVGLGEFKMASLWDLAFVATDPQRAQDKPTPYLILRDGKLEKGEIQLPIVRYNPTEPPRGNE
ncbi:MAG: hypothetical protein U1D30_16690 [Planctomycetota bacterium]